MATFVIRGGRRIGGVHKPPGNKNAVLPMLAACVLTDEPVCLQNIPLIEDVHTMLAILDELGVSVALKGHSVTLCAKDIRKHRLVPSLCEKVRSSILFAGPLSARHGRATIFQPGGDVIGRRRLDTHFDALHALGITVCESDGFAFTCRKLRGSDILLDEASVTATENVVMAATLAKGKTTIFNAACEPHVQDLCHMLNSMGARIDGVGTNYIRVHGVESLGGVTYRVAPDYVETVSLIAAAALTGGTLTVADARSSDLGVIARHFSRLGIHWSCRDDTACLAASQNLTIENDFGAAIPKIEDGPWPNFPSDLMSVAIVLATQAQGTMLFFEKMFESRMYFVDSLIRMGARVVQCDPHRVIVDGPSPLRGAHMSSPDIRAGIALLLAALCAHGESRIHHAQMIDRGYEHVDKRLRALGADIQRMK